MSLTVSLVAPSLAATHAVAASRRRVLPAW